ncbi:hypothetical protein [Thalassobacillus sp. C254]|uniref:hypothetical protein n=1 Tax=Thalassobacillus sp. C254 TaxID=1225341 RepID=UPI0006CF3139|nr:hypothetical protein [Thalassobacillus sp. C254]
MAEKIKISVVVTLLAYTVLIVLSLLITSGIDGEMIGMWGIWAGVILLIAALPLSKNARRSRQQDVTIDESVQANATKESNESVQKQNPPVVAGVVWGATVTIVIALGLLFI